MSIRSDRKKTAGKSQMALLPSTRLWIRARRRTGSVSREASRRSCERFGCGIMCAMCRQGLKVRCSRAACREEVPVRGRPAPITWSETP